MEYSRILHRNIKNMEYTLFTYASRAHSRVELLVISDTHQYTSKTYSFICKVELPNIDSRLDCYAPTVPRTCRPRIRRSTDAPPLFPPFFPPFLFLFPQFLFICFFWSVYLRMYERAYLADLYPYGDNSKMQVCRPVVT